MSLRQAFCAIANTECGQNCANAQFMQQIAQTAKNPLVNCILQGIMRQSAEFGRTYPAVFAVDSGIWRKIAPTILDCAAALPLRQTSLIPSH